ncbi:hypothetical protein AM344_04730 [Escherichia coli]|nr:hypothetical protein AM344_04730 [Escherichia coli]EFO1942865.1 hypothetical protein [Escherichia coli]EGE3616560.1 hypothetical protein [Escherichia coli]EGE3898360.1 hypothetical protein [Escherichia coli]KAA1966412.1 hypothetical protein EA212_21165 [Escherichia coli]
MVSLALSRFFQIVTFFQKHPEFDLTIYLWPISVPYMPQKTPQQISSLFMVLRVKTITVENYSIHALSKLHQPTAKRYFKAY